MISLFLYTLINTFTLGIASPNSNTEPIEQQKNCLTIENFNAITRFIEDYGEPIKISKRLIADKESLVLETSIGRRFVQLENYQNHKNIIIIDKNKTANIPPYFVSNEGREIQISAYYSRFDTNQDLKIRAADWCAIVSVLTKKQ